MMASLRLRTPNLETVRCVHSSSRVREFGSLMHRPANCILLSFLYRSTDKLFHTKRQVVTWRRATALRSPMLLALLVKIQPYWDLAVLQIISGVDERGMRNECRNCVECEMQRSIFQITWAPRFFLAVTCKQRGHYWSVIWRLQLSKECPQRTLYADCKFMFQDADQAYECMEWKSETRYQENLLQVDTKKFSEVWSLCLSDPPSVRLRSKFLAWDFPTLGQCSFESAPPSSTSSSTCNRIRSMMKDQHQESSILDFWGATLGEFFYHEQDSGIRN